MSQPTIEPTPVSRTPNRRWRWLGAAVCALAVVVVVYFAEAYRRIQVLESAVASAGGAVRSPPSVWQVMRQRWLGEPVENQTYVVLQESMIDGDWLRAHDNLRELNIDGLYINQCSLTADEAAELAQTHPLSQFVAWDVPNMDGVAAALDRIPTLRNLNLSKSDLTDTGLQRLPLEQLHEFRIADSDVTCAGLLEMRRCRELRHVGLDGRQIDAQVVSVFNELPRMTGLTLTGSDVTDETLRFLHGAKLRSVSLLETSVSKTGMQDMKSTTPDCRILVGERHAL